jgi:hypothetical protein
LLPLTLVREPNLQLLAWLVAGLLLVIFLDKWVLALGP